MLRDLKLKSVYRSETDNLLTDFYIPSLKESVRYDRAVGYFSSAMLSFAAQGLSVFIEQGGKMRLIFGGELLEDEVNAIKEGYDVRKLSERLGNKILQTISNISDALTYRRLEALSWLVANGSLDVKLALTPRGMYHEKIGILTDSTGDRIVFEGSANETAPALLPDFNFESLNVFPTWREEFIDYFIPYIDGFERLWSNKTKNALVIDFPDAAKEHLIKISKRSKPLGTEIEVDLWKKLFAKFTSNPHPESKPNIPKTFHGTDFELRPHQVSALNAWKARDVRGVLAMATGSGKTLTAIYGAVKIFHSLERLFIIIAVPYQALADQWVEELSLFNINAIPCYAGFNNWSDDLSKSIYLFETGAKKFVACVVVNRTLQSEEFQKRLKQVPGKQLLFIGDECHHHSSQGLHDSLPQQARMRLGLSATPEHYFNPALTARIVDYYGEIAYRYSLADALRDGVLTPYDYFIHFIELDDDEADEYLELSKKISRLAAGKNANEVEDTSDSALQMLLFKRARLLGNASNKISTLHQLLEKTKPAPFTLFYCGDGSTEIDSDDEPLRQVDEVSTILYQLGWKVSHFTSRQPREERKKILDRFRTELLDGVIAIKCLDEGIDVPDCRTAYILASSRNPKQFIQRRGRILRRSPGKEISVIHDFIIKLPKGVCKDSELERNLLIAELKRVSEFGRLSLNEGEVFDTLKPILDDYDLHHFFI